MKKLLSIVLILLGLSAKSQTTYYISSSGDDANTGTSPASPKKTIPTLVCKSTYLLNKGDTFYNRITRANTTLSNTITIGAYGTGAKPVLSLYTKILSTAWVADAANIWKADFTNLVNFSESTGGGMTPNIGFLKLNGTTIKGAKKSTKAGMTEAWDFFSDSTYLYVYATSKPSSLASKIEASTDNNAINISNNMTIDGIKIIGSGQHAIGTFHQQNIIIRNTDIAEIGGCYLGNYGSGTTRYGNGIQIFNGGVNNLIEGCTIKQVYDVGLTMQTANSSSLWLFRDITFRNNLVDSCDQGFENTLSTTTMNLDSSGYVNCIIVNNRFSNAGYGWSYSLRPHPRGTALVSYQWHTTKNDLVFEGNYVYKPRNGLYYGSDGSGNTSNIPPYASHNNDIWLNANTSIRMKEDSYSLLYPWTVVKYQDFVNATGKEIGSTWHNLDALSNMPPTVSITSPLSNATLKASASIIITATANDDDGSISKVDFYNGNTLIGSDSTNPYSITWSNVAAGNYSLTAKATDNESLTTSSTVAITVSPANNAPSVSIVSPAANATFDAGANITISATAADADGSITKVDFYNGTTLIGSDNTSPYSITWDNVAAGNYSLTAKATDNGSLVTISSSITVSVSGANKVLSAPSVSITSPQINATFDTTTTIIISAVAADVDGSVAKVDFYYDNTLLGSDNSIPYSFTWKGATAGKHLLTAKAYDNDGLATVSSSVPVVISIPLDFAFESFSGTVNQKLINLSWSTNNTGNSSYFKVLRGKGKMSLKEINRVSAISGTFESLDYTFADLAPLKGSNYYEIIQVDVYGNTVTSTILLVDNSGTSKTMAKPSQVADNTFTKVTNEPKNTAENSLEAFSIKVGPNPTNGVLFVILNGIQKSKELKVSVLSITGSVFKTVETGMSNRVIKLNVSSLDAGIYLVQVVSGNKIFYKRFVKQQ